MNEVTILGPGGVGGFLAAALWDVGVDVTVVAREETAELINRDGISLNSVRLGEFTALPQAVARLDTPPAVLIVSTKATSLREALVRIEAPPRLVVPLLNGLDHMRTLRDRFGAGTVAAGAIRIEADRPAPGVITQTSPFLRIDLAADDKRLDGRLDALTAALEEAEIPTERGASEAQILWRKLVRLNALALTTSATDRPVGFIRSDPWWRETLIRCISEAAAVANADGAHIDPAEPLQELDEAHAELGSSMQRDIAAGRPTELEAIAGSVLRAGARHGLRCPTVERLAARVAQRTQAAARRR